MLKVLGRKTSGNVQKVIFALEEMGLAYEREDYGRQFGNTASADYLAMNPTAKVPTLVDGDVVIWESNTILRYLADSYGQAFTGYTPAQRSAVERWMDFLLAAINTGYVNAFKSAKQEPADRPAGLDEQIAELHAQMKLLDAYLAGKSFLALDRLTIADMALAPIMARCLSFPYDRPAMPALEAWQAGLAGRAAFQKATG
jgi:glutathione S-transferase